MMRPAIHLALMRAENFGQPMQTVQTQPENAGGINYSNRMDGYPAMRLRSKNKLSMIMSATPIEIALSATLNAGQDQSL